jgi:hypothetical protein
VRVKGVDSALTAWRSVEFVGIGGSAQVGRFIGRRDELPQRACGPSSAITE